MSILKKICRGIDTFNDALGRVLSLSILGVVAVIMCEVILRRLFGKPQIWTTDLITMLFGAYTILTLALGLQHGTFVKVDLVVERMKRVAAHWLQLVTTLVFQIPFIWYLTPRAYAFFLKSITVGEHGYSVWAPILWPVKLALFIGLCLLSLQVVSELLKEVDWLVSFYKNGRQDPPETGSMSILVARAKAKAAN